LDSLELVHKGTHSFGLTAAVVLVTTRASIFMKADATTTTEISWASLKETMVLI
jgi:hypothetical protein